MYLFALKKGVIPANARGITYLAVDTPKMALPFAQRWCRENMTDSVFCLKEFTPKMREMSPEKLTRHVRTYGMFLCMR